MSRFTEEMKLIPRAAWFIATILCVVVPVIFCVYWVLVIGPATEFPTRQFPFFFIGIAAAAVAMYVYILLMGYIAADAKRRGMRVVLWVLLAIFIPNAIGIILYFILREPLLRRCGECGVSVSSANAFCPSCGASLGAACPSCRSPVETGWSHCGRCGASLRSA